MWLFGFWRSYSDFCNATANRVFKTFLTVGLSRSLSRLILSNYCMYWHTTSIPVASALFSFSFLFFFFLEKDEILVQNFVRQNGWYLAKIFCISKYLAIYHFFEIRICEIWVWHKTRVLKTQVLKKRPLTWIILIKKMTYGTRVYEARVLCNMLLKFIKPEYHIPHDTHNHTLFALPPSATHPTSHN